MRDTLAKMSIKISFNSECHRFPKIIATLYTHLNIMKILSIYIFSLLTTEYISIFYSIHFETEYNGYITESF